MRFLQPGILKFLKGNIFYDTVHKVLKHFTNHRVSQTISSGVSAVQQMQRLSITSQRIEIWIQLKLIDLFTQTF